MAPRVAIVCRATKSVVARQYTHVHPGVSVKAGEAVKRKKFINKVVAECDLSEVTRKARAIGIEAGIHT